MFSVEFVFFFCCSPVIKRKFFLYYLGYFNTVCNIDDFINLTKIKFSLYWRYFAEACNELRGSSPQLSAWATKKHHWRGEQSATLRLIWPARKLNLKSPASIAMFHHFANPSIKFLLVKNWVMTDDNIQVWSQCEEWSKDDSYSAVFICFS